jgi:2-amino-4-hydroxy-6-hydroxymethyldihydropteridine diphosphokinase
MAMVFLSLGSNFNKRLDNIQNAIKLLNQNNIIVTNISPIYETEPVGNLSILGITCPFQLRQKKFLNCVIETSTNYEPEEVLFVIQSIEKSLGRRRIKGIANLPRTIDIDILFYDDKIINLPTRFAESRRVFKIPHPKIEIRAFVLVPLSDLAPDFIHPVLKKTIRELTKRVDKKGVMTWQPKTTPIPA